MLFVNFTTKTGFLAQGLRVDVFVNNFMIPLYLRHAASRLMKISGISKCYLLITVLVGMTNKILD